MMRRILLFTFFLTTMLSTNAQSSLKSSTTTLKGLVYNKETTFDITVHTPGVGLAFGINFGTIQTYYKTTYYHLQVGEIRHVKGNRTSADSGGGISNRSARSYFFGKENNLYVIRAGKGGKRYLSEKAKDKGLAIGFSYEGGLTLGLLKPYYLELRYLQDGVPEIRSEKYSDENAGAFLNINRNSIYGASGFTKGLNEIRPVPGVHFKVGAHFDWGAFDEMVKALEAGVMVDVFYRKIPLMVENELITNAENRPFFINLYLTLQLGKRR